MQPGHQPPMRSSNRAPGSFAPLPASSNASTAPLRPPPLLIDSGLDQDTIALAVTTGGAGSSRSRWPEGAPATPIYNQFSASARPSAVAAAAASQHASPGLTSPALKSHSRKHSATQGFFDSTLPWMTTTTTPTTSSPSVASHSTLNSSLSPQSAASQKQPSAGISTSQMAAKAAVISHQNPSHQNSSSHASSHVRQRSQTVPFPGDVNNDGPRRGSSGKAPLSPPLLSLTEASAPRESVFGVAAGKHQVDRAHSSAATAAANVVFPRSAHGSPRQKTASPQSIPPVPPIPPPKPEKPSKVKLFSRPGKIGTSKADAKDKALPSPSKIGTALSALQRGNFSTSSLVDPSAPSIYSLTNSSTATIRPVDTATEEKEKGKEKDSKKHHFLSRQKQKLKDEYHLPLSSAASNSRPTDPSAPSSLYNFNLPGSPGPGSANFVKAKREKKLAERSEGRLDGELNPSLAGDRIGPTGLPPQLSQLSSLYDPIDFVKLGLQSHVSLDDAWPYLKAKLLVVFEGEDLRIPVEDFNRFVQMHIQWCMHRRNPGGMLDDIRDLLTTGFSSLDRTLRLAPEDRFVPTLVELWLVTFTSILPYMQSVFLPLELEVSGSGIIMTAEQARDFWGGLVPATAAAAAGGGEAPDVSAAARMAQAASLLDVRRLVLTAYRDTIILPRYETLKSLFSRLSLEFLPLSMAAMALASPPPDGTLSASPSESLSSMARPGTAMSLDPSVGSYTSTGTTLLGDGSERGRSRAVSNVSYGSHGSDGAGGGVGAAAAAATGAATRPFTPSGVHMLSSVREQNVQDSKTVTDMVGRMLQCMSVLSSLGCVGHEDDESSRKMVELCKMLKLNWLGRGRTGRNRRGIVGGRVRRDGAKDEVRVA
ncbi:hypothetical protein CDD81_2536 [Ophiocordyceps australis]|uniref:HbrB-like protein n=1 Tax=Ophiocordyceps australis TaxID=1399860 RepID=A0A2C5YDR6_9HYPO|nr:hypothetical protein CDD81_2536 [Ophiocordyceps australis]